MKEVVYILETYGIFPYIHTYIQLITGRYLYNTRIQSMKEGPWQKGYIYRLLYIVLIQVTLCSIYKKCHMLDGNTRRYRRKVQKAFLSVEKKEHIYECIQASHTAYRAAIHLLLPPPTRLHFLATVIKLLSFFIYFS